MASAYTPYATEDMKVIGSVIARLGSKRLRYKNILPFGGVPMLGLGIQKLHAASLVDEVVVSTESEIIARTAYDFGATILRRPPELARDNVPSIPVFQHLMENFPGAIHVNLNINFPLCDPSVINRAVEIAATTGEALSVPFAVWAQTYDCLQQYGDPWQITATRFDDPRAGPLDIHEEADLLASMRHHQGSLPGWEIIPEQHQRLCSA